MMLYVLLFWEFLKVGLFAIGGGMVTVPFLYDMADRHPWFTREMVTNMIAISESTPGPIGINMATFAGFTAGFAQNGIWGGIIGGILTSLSLILPAFLLVLVLAGVLLRFYTHPVVESVFSFLRPAVTGLIAAAGCTVLLGVIQFRPDMGEGWGLIAALLDFKVWVLFGVLLFSVLKWKKHPVIYLAAAAVAGIVLGL